MSGLSHTQSTLEQTDELLLSTLTLDQLFIRLKSRSDGLTSHEASYRLRVYLPFRTLTQRIFN